MLFPHAALHLGNPFTAPNRDVKVPRKIAYCVYEKGTYERGGPGPARPVPTDDFHLGWIEFSQRNLSLQDIDSLCRTQQSAIRSLTLTHEKVHLVLREEIQRSEVFPFDDTYSVLEIFLVEDPRPYLHPEAFIEHPWDSIYWDPRAELSVYDQFDPGYFDIEEDDPDLESANESNDSDEQPPLLLIIEQEDSSDSDSDVEIVELVSNDPDTDADLWE